MSSVKAEGDPRTPHPSHHPTANYWLAESLMAVIGTVFNALTLWIFYNERQALIRSVNIMTRFFHKRTKMNY